ncbi:MAG: anaerobic ribonucleoside-triphosphate reductase [archaeon]
MIYMLRQKCEIYSRIVGSITPTSRWNPGKKEEFKDRKTYKILTPQYKKNQG